MSKFKLLVISGISGSGKSVLENSLNTLYPDLFNKWVQVTTRSMRENETQGSPYVFVSRKKFKALLPHLTGLNGVKENSIFQSQYGSFFDFDSKHIATVILSGEGIESLLEDIDSGKVEITREEVCIIMIDAENNTPFVTREGRSQESLDAEREALLPYADKVFTVSNGRYLDPSDVVHYVTN